MAHLINPFQDPADAPELLSAQRRNLPALLEHLLLTVPSIAALYSELAEFLLQTVGVDAAWMGAPDAQESMHPQFSAGTGMEELSRRVIEVGTNPDGLLARAWGTGTPQFASGWQKDENPLPGSFWREHGLRLGWRSCCAIPVTGATGKRDILVLCSKHRHFFAKEDVRQLVLHVHNILGFALERLRLIGAMEQSQRTLTLYKTAMDASADGILIAEAVEGMPIRYVNHAFERITGYTAEEAIGKNYSFLQGADPDQARTAAVRDALHTGKPCTIELQNYRKNGTMFWSSLSLAPILNCAGAVTHFIGIQQDITHLKSILNENVRSNALYRALMAAAEIVIGAENERQLLNELCRLLVESGLFAQVWIGRPNSAGDMEIQAIYSTIDQEDSTPLPNVYTGDEKSALAVRAWRHSQLQFTNDRDANPEGTSSLSFYEKHDVHATAVVPLYRDGEIWALLTLLSREVNIFNAELLELMERIGRLAGHGLDALDLRQILEEERKYQAWLARHDPLTDILNRRGLIERLEDGISRARRGNHSLAVALLDLNDFRVLHDLHGHPACDLLLRTVAERLQAPLRQGDAVGRLGGNEFVLILEGVHSETDLTAVLSRIQASVEEPIHLPNGRTAVLRTSIGVTLFPEDDSTPEHLLRHADRALYALKERGEETGPRWMMFRPEADERIRNRQKTILTLFRKGNVRIYYQPIIDLQTGSAIRVEALARLASDDSGILSPADFLPQFSPTELTALMFQVLAQSIEDLHRLDKAGFHLNVGINFDPVTLADPEAMLDLRQQIQNSGLSTRRIVLELLERADTLSMADAQEALRELKTSGVRIALDDVGSAYSSLLRMKDLPVDMIKLDRSFSIGLERHPKELRFLMNLVNLAQALGLELIAEGIESDACRDALSALGVQRAQGYAIAMPMDIEELEKWLRRYQPVAWTGPTSLLGEVAMQLRDLDAAGRILNQQPSFLQHLVSHDPDSAYQLGLRVQAIGPEASKLLSTHRAWRTTMSSLLARSRGSVDRIAFQNARTAYEEELFGAVLDISPEAE